MRLFIGRFTIGLLAVAATALIACGGGDDDSSSAATQAPTTAATEAPAAASVSVALAEFTLVPDQSSVGAGEVTFDVANNGAAPHELVVIRSDEDPGALPQAAGLADESGLDVIGRTELIQGAASESITFTLSAGSYLLICNLPAHYPLGMSAAFTVE